MSVRAWTFLFVAVSFGLYLLIAWLSRVRDTSGFYVAGRGVPALANGMATAADWMSAASFLSMAGLISTLGYSGGMYLMGWTGGYVLLALLLAPYLRKFGHYTVPDFIGDRYESNAARLVAVVCAIFVSFTYVAGQMRGVGIVFSRFLEVDITVGVAIGMAIVFVYATLGGMKGITWTQVAQYWVLITAFLVPAIAISIDDVQAAVPRPIDAMPLLPYLTNPDQASIRRWNYTEVGVNLQAGGAINGPCVITGGCTQIPVTKSVCEDNNGVWWGDGLDDPITAGAPEGGFTYCCEVNAFVVANGRVEMPYNITPLVSVGIRNDRYKIVENSVLAYVSVDQPCMQQTVPEFYEIDEAIPLPRLDRSGTNFPLDALTPEQQDNYDELSAELAALRASVPDCPGDGNIDFVVDDQDLDDWRFFSETYGTSSVYDLNLDGLTNEADESIIEANLGLDCRAPRAPFDTAPERTAPTQGDR